MSDGTDTHLLIVDDDERIRGLLQKFLIRNGFWVSAARDAAHARRLLDGLEFDMIVMDVMMPGEDGISLTRDLRGRIATPILLLTAKGGETEDRIAGLEAGGADDYLAKPFEPKELLLRINAILRRVPQVAADLAPKMLQLGPVRYDVERGELWSGEDLVRLTATESQLMKIFAGSVGEPVSRGGIWSNSWAVRKARRRNARWMFRSPVCARRSRPTRNNRVSCKPCVEQATCWHRSRCRYRSGQFR